MRNALLLALSFAAGYIDALSYLGLGRVFTANMTGNTVLLGIALAQHDGAAALRSGLALGGFLAGVALAAWIVERDHSENRWPGAVTYALMVEATVLGALALGWALVAHDPPASWTAMLIVLSAIAMGVQSAAVHRLEVSGITTTTTTGTLTNLVARLMGRERRKSRRIFDRAPLLATVWTVYLAGAAIGATILSGERTIALAVPVSLISAVVAVAAIAFRRGRIRMP